MPEHEHQGFISPLFSLPDQPDYYQGYLQLRPQQQFPSGLLYHWLLKAEIICCCWLPCCWTSLHSGRCFCFSQATDSLMAPFLLPPGTPDHLLLSGEAGETTYAITTLLFWVLPSWRTTECLNKADTLQSCMVLKQLRSLSIFENDYHHVMPRGSKYIQGVSIKTE